MVIIITISISATLIIKTIIITEMMTCNEVETKAGRCSPRELTGVHAAQPSCTLGRLLVNIDMLLLVMRMMSIVMLMILLVMMTISSMVTIHNLHEDDDLSQGQVVRVADEDDQHSDVGDHHDYVGDDSG